MLKLIIFNLNMVFCHKMFFYMASTASMAFTAFVIYLLYILYVRRSAL